MSHRLINFIDIKHVIYTKSLGNDVLNSWWPNKPSAITHAELDHNQEARASVACRQLYLICFYHFTFYNMPDWLRFSECCAVGKRNYYFNRPNDVPSLHRHTVTPAPNILYCMPSTYWCSVETYFWMFSTPSTTTSYRAAWDYELKFN